MSPEPSGDFPDLGSSAGALGLDAVEQTADGRFRAGRGGVRAVGRTRDRKLEWVGMETGTLARVDSSMGYPAYYPVPPLREEKVSAVLMDLDGTTVHSEAFWIWMIQLSLASLLDRPAFELEEADLPFISGHSVSEHLQYGIRKYCPDRSLEEARDFYFTHTRREMKKILEGTGRTGAFAPAPGVKEFLLALKAGGIRIGLVTSGLHEKAWPEIVDAFRVMKLGNPLDFYDAIMTAGHMPGRGEAGTLGELCPKPHPWLYAETARVGLGISFEARGSVVGIEDSAAGIYSIRLAGFTPLGITGGNLYDGGADRFCTKICSDFPSLLQRIHHLADSL